MRWLISDIHACFYTLTSLLGKIRTIDDSPQFIFIGDYVDRGNYSWDVVNLVIQLQKDGAICLRGNHDNVIDWILNEHYVGDIREHIRGNPSYDSVVPWWLQNGLKPTLTSYTASFIPEECGTYGGQNWGGVVMKFRECAPEEHKQFFKNLPLFWQCETHFACHAYFPVNVDLPKDFNNINITPEVANNTLWERFNSENSSHNFLPPKEIVWDKIGVFGHTPVQYYNMVAPIKYDKIRLIDCHAFNGGYLCAYSCELDDHVLQATDSRDIQ